MSLGWFVLKWKQTYQYKNKKGEKETTDGFFNQNKL